MNSKRVSYLMSGFLVILVLAVIGSAVLANMLLEKQAHTLSDLKLNSQVLDQQQTSLIKAKKDIKKYEALDTIARTIVPQDKDQAQTVREIVKIAGDSGITPTSISFPSSTLGSATTVRPATGTASTAPAANTNLTQLIPVKGTPGLYTLQITINQDASSPVEYSKFLDFLSRLEQNRRTAQVSGIVLQPSATDRNKLSFTLTVDEYIKP